MTNYVFGSEKKKKKSLLRNIPFSYSHNTILVAIVSECISPKIHLECKNSIPFPKSRYILFGLVWFRVFCFGLIVVVFVVTVTVFVINALRTQLYTFA